MRTAHLNANKLWCRVRCFGLPLYSAAAREALTERLGLLLECPTTFSGKGDLCEKNFSPMSALGQKLTCVMQEAMSASQ
jgi:hypothetical protein